MYCDLFEFNGIKSDEVGAGYMIMNFDGFNNDGVISAGNEITFSSSKPANSLKWNFHGAKYENQMTTSFQIGKIVCTGSQDDYELSNQECAFLLRWLQRSDGYKYLRFFQGGYEGYENSFFRCQIKVSWIKVKGKIFGVQCDVTCDAPFGYSDQKIFEVSCNNGDTFTIYDDSDRMGAIYFESVDIMPKENISELRISNSMDTIYSPTLTYATVIKNCQNGEQITIAGNTIRTTNEGMHTKGNINNDFNFKYPRLINTSDLNELRRNDYTLTGGKCDLSFSYRTIRTVMP